jgi:hypothetical protein
LYYLKEFLLCMYTLPLLYYPQNATIKICFSDVENWKTWCFLCVLIYCIWIFYGFLWSFVVIQNDDSFIWNLYRFGKETGDEWHCWDSNCKVSYSKPKFCLYEMVQSTANPLAVLHKKSQIIILGQEFSLHPKTHPFENRSQN